MVFFSVHADEERVSVSGLGVPISDEYREGKYLIYDCEGGFFACVGIYSFDRCKEKRQKAFSEKAFKLPCAQLKKFNSFVRCNKMHYKWMTTIVDKSFCLRKEKDVIKY